MHLFVSMFAFVIEVGYIFVIGRIGIHEKDVDHTHTKLLFSSKRINTPAHSYIR